MPATYPPAPPTLSGDLLTISRFLNSPTAIQRRLRTYVDLRFVSDQVLTNRFNASGGAALYTLSEPFLTDRAVGAVAPGAVYPQAEAPFGTAGIAAVSKWGQKVPLTDEEIDRNVFLSQVIDRTMQKVVNSVINQVDSIAMSAVSSVVTQSFGGTSWIGATPTMLRDILQARKAIVAQNLGYRPDSLLVGDNAYAFLMSDQTVTNALRREDSTNPIYTGQIERLAGLTIVVSPHAPTNPLVFDSTQLGGMADESGAGPGYAVSDLAVEVKSIRVEGNDKWDLQGRRLTVPVIQEPGAGCRITGTHS